MGEDEGEDGAEHGRRGEPLAGEPPAALGMAGAAGGRRAGGSGAPRVAPLVGLGRGAARQALQLGHQRFLVHFDILVIGLYENLGFRRLKIGF